MTATIQINDSVAIVLASARNLVTNTLAVAASRCEVIDARDKAVKLQSTTARGKVVTAWFPRKALASIGDAAALHGQNTAHHTVRLAPWFKADDWTARFLEMTTRH